MSPQFRVNDVFEAVISKSLPFRVIRFGARVERSRVEQNGRMGRSKYMQHIFSNAIFPS